MVVHAGITDISDLVYSQLLYCYKTMEIII